MVSRNHLILVVALALISSTMCASAAQDYEVGGPLAGLKLPRNKTGQWAEVELYPGSVEHYRAYMSKYLPVRSFFDQQSLRRNWVAPNIPGAEGKPVEPYRAPVYNLGQSTTGAKTDKFWPPAGVVRCRVKDPIVV